MYLQSSYICETRLRFRSGGTVWQFGFRRRLPKKRASAKETVWISTVTVRSSFARPGGGMNSRNLSRGSRPKNRHRECAGDRRFHLVDVRSSNRPRAGGPSSGARAESESIQREIRPCAGLPITKQAEGYPFEVAVPANHSATCVILADRVKSVDDWRVRSAEKAGRCPSESVDEVRARLAPPLGY
jgi:mRNA interferase MazF